MYLVSTCFMCLWLHGSVPLLHFQLTSLARTIRKKPTKPTKSTLPLSLYSANCKNCDGYNSLYICFCLDQPATHHPFGCQVEGKFDFSSAFCYPSSPHSPSDSPPDSPTHSPFTFSFFHFLFIPLLCVLLVVAIVQLVITGPGEWTTAKAKSNQEEQKEREEKSDVSCLMKEIHCTSCELFLHLSFSSSFPSLRCSMACCTCAYTQLVRNLRAEVFRTGINGFSW